MDRGKVIEGLEAMREFFGFGLQSQSPVFEAYQNILTNAVALLKDQNDCENCAIAIEDRQPVVLCKDCKFRQSRVSRIIDGKSVIIARW